ncbi:hypothetical protein CHS0354_026229 [Potamilus streckersoni]|uniref:Uncharacterized protein n=1 Tax=Potamilus streckersoni TaxID=2493646 RepID=A0AAE0VZT4_9BIVA|nr:hypothetical protein CHS0354_020533 [Potamilus streckersoni]KAK3609309.1 hypothetical protein CHS0354_026229 [Potamilus streckersoni]
MLKMAFLYKWNIFLIAQLVQWSNCQVSCPDECWCTETFIECQTLMELPKIFPHSETVQKIKLQDLNINNVPGQSFAKMTKLNSLIITVSNIAFIDSCAFYGVPNLMELTIEKSAIGSIFEYAFSNISGIETFTLERNKIGYIAPFAFSHLKNVKKMDITSSGITVLSGQSFYSLYNISSLRFLDNTIGKYSSGAFQNLASVERFEERGNNISNFECGNAYFDSSSVGQYLFAGNVIKCNCTLMWLMNTRHGGTFESILKDNRCWGSMKIQDGTSLANVTLGELGCPEQNLDHLCTASTAHSHPKCSSRTQKPPTPREHWLQTHNEEANKDVKRGIAVVPIASYELLSLLTTVYILLVFTLIQR